MLPDINSNRRRPPMNESFQSMGNMARMGGAAGFKRDNVSGRGVPDPGLTGFTYNDPNSTRVSGMPSEEKIGASGMGSYKPTQQSSPMRALDLTQRRSGQTSSVSDQALDLTQEVSGQHGSGAV